jgi:transposase, IS5 family
MAMWNAAVLRWLAANLHGGDRMRFTFDPQPSLSTTPILDVELNLQCRDEIIPILRALQHVYGEPELRREILKLVGQDVNRYSSRKRGRKGMDYWQVIVLAAVRLGCNLNFDKLQDLAEQHRALRQIMGIGAWDVHVHFDWRRIRDNIDWLRPQTLRKINECIVAAGHRLAPKAAESVRGDSFVVETNIHYPTDSSLIGDGLRKILQVSAALAAALRIRGWRQHQHLLKKMRGLVRAINAATRSRARNKSERIQRAYQPLFQFADELLGRARELEWKSIRAAGLEAMALRQQLQHFRQLTERVCGYSKRRVLHGEVIPNHEKLFSMFEPHTELIRRGKMPEENQFGHSVLVIEDGVGFICAYQVMPAGHQDRDVVVPELRKLQTRLRGKIRRASFDQAFHSPENQEALAEIVAIPCVPIPGVPGADQHANVEFRRARQHHPGVESAINGLQAGNGLKRCRDRTELGYDRYVGLGVLGRNLHVLGKVLLAREARDSEAARSKRKRLCA